MGYLSKLKQMLSGNIDLSKTLRENFGYIASLTSGENSDDLHRRRQVLNSLVFEILQKDGVPDPYRQEVYCRLLEDRFDHGFAEKSINDLLEHNHLPLEEAVTELQQWNKRQRKQLIEFLLALAVAVGNLSEHIELVFDICSKVDLSRAELNELYVKLRKEIREQKFAVSSAWGLLVALVVMLVFFLAAKLLESLIYGLIIACVLLPLEKFFERRIRSRKGFIYGLVKVLSIINTPLLRLSRAITRKEKKLSMAAKNVLHKRKIERRPIIQAVGLTSVVAVIVIVAFAFGLTFLTGQYMNKLRGSLRHMEVRRQYDQRHNGGVQESRFDYYVDKLRDRFQEFPPVRMGLEQVGKILEDPDTQGQMLGSFYANRHDESKTAFNLLNAVISFLCNAMLSIFFALLFLIKLAQFCRNDDSDKQKSEYLIRFVFNGVWLPRADEKVIREARRIIEGVFFRLRVWLKGYLTLVLVDATVYTTIFFFLGLPFFLLLGLLAGCGILLPYLGPIISCVITVLVSLAVGDVSGSTLLLIMVSYLIYNGIIEQFILYPAVIGEALGLSTLETIIVVLLGAVFAGITGMLFALPVASVAKYIIPQLYHSFSHRHFIKKNSKAG